MNDGSKQTILATPAEVLLCVKDAELSQRCQNALADSGMRVWRDWGQSPGSVQPDVIVVSGETGQGSADATCRDQGDSRSAVLWLGVAQGEADLELSLDFLPRELVAACRLLGEIARLRRRLAEGQDARIRFEAEAQTDPLTGLPNRRAWNAELQRRLAQRPRGPLCVALADIDHLKQVNDGFGHMAGDQLLLATAEALQQSLRQGDFVARLGGDEFGMLLSTLDDDAAGAVFERVLKGLPTRLAARTRQVTSVSIGYACCRPEARLSAEVMMELADQALRRAKRQGRDRAVAAESTERHSDEPGVAQG